MSTRTNQQKITQIAGLKLDRATRCALALYRGDVHDKHARIWKMGNHVDADDGGRVFVHRFVYRFYHPDETIKSGELIHHKNENPLDNRKDNLVKVTRPVHMSIHDELDYY